MTRDTALHKPFVYWGQNRQFVFFKVEIGELEEDPKIELTKRAIKFAAYGLGVSGKNNYGFKIDFYRPINVKQSRHKVTGRAIEIICEKAECEKWSRVTETAQKISWLKTDFDKFAFDSSDESSQDENNINEAKESARTKQLMEKYEKEYKEAYTTGFSVRKDLKKTYLIMYNIFQFIGYTYILISVSSHLIRKSPDSQKNAFNYLGSQVMVCQGVAVLEIFHSLLGWVKSGVGASIMQVVGRGIILFAMVLPEPKLHEKEILWFLFLTWSAVEVIRYPYYLLGILKKEVGLVTWLRYTIWIPLYPLGFMLEGLIMLIALPLYEESGRLDISLPNKLNFSFHFPTFLKFYMFICLPGMYLLMQRMYEQRKSKLNKNSSFVTKARKSKASSKYEGKNL